MMLKFKTVVLGLCLYLFSVNAAAQDLLQFLNAEKYGPGTLIKTMEQVKDFSASSVTDTLIPLLSHEDLDVAKMAAWILRRMGRVGVASNAVLQVLEDAQSPIENRCSAALSLGELRAVGSLSNLANILGSDLIEEVRVACANALGQLHRIEAETSLTDALQNDESALVRRAAAAGLGNLEGIGSAGLVAALSDSDVFVRLEAAWALGRHKLHDAIGVLVRALQSDSDCRVQAAAAWALGEIGDSSALEALRAAKNSSCRLTVQAAGWALLKII
jgi:HEAT repeat protein